MGGVRTVGQGMAERFGYMVDFHGIGARGDQVEAPTQMAVFRQ